MPYASRILCIDDEENILNAFRRAFRKSGYEIHTTTDPEEALALGAKLPFSVIISDQRMPRMEGVAVLQRFKEISPDTTRIMLTGYADLQAAVQAVNASQVFRFLAKPWDEEAFRGVLDQAIEQNRLIVENRALHELTRKQNEELSRLNADLERRVVERTEKIAGLNLRLERSFLECVKVIGGMAEYSGALPGGHSKRVARLAGDLARALDAGGMKEILNIQIAAYLHDIGKIGLGEDHRLHPARGAKIVRMVPGLEKAAEMILRHHERMDGQGQIPLGARIIAVVDAYDHLVNAQNASPPPLALADLRKRTGGEFDPRVVQALETFLTESGQLGQDSVEMEIELYELRPGMKTSRPIRTQDGHQLLGAGFDLDTDTLERLWKRHMDTPLCNEVFIYRMNGGRSL